MSDKKSIGRSKKTSMKCTKERFRRAKINYYIEELRDVIKDSTPFMSVDSRYENAEILEIAVNLISSNRGENLVTEKTFQNGFGYCRDETIKFLNDIETNQSKRITNVIQKCLYSGESEQTTFENENEEEQILLRDVVHNKELVEPLRNRVVLDKLRNKIFEKRRQRRAFQRVQMNNGENMWRPW